MPREYYLNRTGNPRAELDSASWCAEQALRLSDVLKYENGKNEAILLKGDAFLRKKEIGPAINLMGTLHDSTRFRLLIMLGKHYLFRTARSKKDLDSSLLFFEMANKIAPDQLSEKWRPEYMHIKAMCSFITEGLPQSKNHYQQMIDKISYPGNEEREALLWHDLAQLIPSRDSTGITRMYCFEKLISLFRKTGDQEKEIDALKDVAVMNLSHGRLDLAESQLLNLLERYKAFGNRKLHDVYDLLSGLYRNKGDFSKALIYSLKTIESAAATNDTTRITTFYSRMANMFRELGQPEKSVEWFGKMFRERKFTGSTNLYMFRDAGFLARELIKLKKEREALAFLLDIKTKNNPIGVYAKASLLGSLAYCYHVMNQHQQADKYYLELISLTGELQKNNEITTDTHYEIGQYFMDEREYTKAAAFFHKALNASSGINNASDIKGIYLMLYKAYAAIGDYKSANIYLIRNKEISDSIFTENKSRQIEELQIQYETAKKEKDIKLLNNQNQLQRISVEQATKTKNITLAFVALLLIIVGLLYNRYIIKQRSNRKLEANQKELDQKNLFLETLNADQDKLLKEKEWLIKEVHHRVKNNLQMVTGLLYSQSMYLEDETARLAVNDSLRRMQAMSLIHQKLYQDENTTTIEMPAYIDDLVRYLHESFDTNNQIVFEQAIEPVCLDVSQAIPLGLIITECVVNAIKYAFLNGQKGVVSIQLQCGTTDQLLLKISDNGIGLPAGFHAMEHHSLGLDLMQGLTRQLKGSFLIESNDGVHVTVRFPVLIK
ncbi:histidine kinase dimerization/phosphoacceptor domain -containing protein [Niastella sp. OAS944]|uniref:tetratricopeptide repeat-containing sensor histidine kinase n=1 Tax=Niastella sp. OAS944 TaxID=2664089 RepID=UPI0035C78E58|nr:two-component sensor histidine kinase [Chitinophagaceae bacterium OAS944]